MNPFADQERFMLACGQTVDISESDTSANVSQANMYGSLIAEELNEFYEAECNIDELDALIDMIVVIIGFGYSCGYDMEGAWHEVMKTNFAKINPETGLVNKREDGKILKPKDWQPPNLAPFVTREK